MGVFRISNKKKILETVEVSRIFGRNSDTELFQNISKINSFMVVNKQHLRWNSTLKKCDYSDFSWKAAYLYLRWAALFSCSLLWNRLLSRFLRNWWWTTTTALECLICCNQHTTLNSNKYEKTKEILSMLITSLFFTS